MLILVSRPESHELLSRIESGLVRGNETELCICGVVVVVAGKLCPLDSFNVGVNPGRITITENS
jgi:hypothetical protein